MRVSFEGDDPSPRVETAPVLTFDLEDGNDNPMDRSKDIEAGSCDSSGFEDFLDEEDDGEKSTSTTDDDTSTNDTIHSSALSPKAKLLQEALACLYFIQTVGTTVLVYFLADGARQAEIEDGLLAGSFYDTHPVVFTLVVALLFSMVGGMAYAYHDILMKTLERLDKRANESSAVVSSLFPAQFRKRLLEERATTTNGGSEENESFSKNPQLCSSKSHFKNFLQQSSASTSSGGWNYTKPIADLFPECSVLFADISGFTAWSSEREPAQVFLLLESLYATFDGIAKQRRVFKVETIGDCYVAVTGLPEVQADHAARMVKFARQLMQRMHVMVKRLESSLGPDTADLRLRVGIHSGPVTAGVLRGDRSRFQLFGDTVNTASRMETTGVKNRIQLSQATADKLIEDGKEHWITPREDLVEAKGLGQMQCYWSLLRTAHGTDGSVSGASRSSGRSSTGSSANKSAGWGIGDKEDNLILALPPMSRSAKNKRLIDWNVEILSQKLKQVVAQRDPNVAAVLDDPNAVIQKRGATPYDEVMEAIELPHFDAKTSYFRDSNSVKLSADVATQLRALVTQIANGYRDNPFHNFEHASHVTMSVTKLLSRIVTPDDVDYDRDSLDVGIDMHNYTYGITSDALSQLGIVFSALIHDLDHPGVSNGQLAEENPELSEKYKKSIAESNSVDIAWNLLMQPEYKDLQQCIFTTEAELQRFRSTIVNSVLATDIFEKDGKAFRNQRWQKAFHSSCDEDSCSHCEDNNNLRATIVIEHIIQASDVSHCMQHWSIYQKWNERLFREMYLAYDEGRSASDPSVGWAKGEIWFFDNYVIPLAKKLAECKVFGVSSNESLNYAEKNRKEWAQKGEQVVKEMVDRYQKRKEMEIGGLTNDEINGFTPQDLEYIMKKLIAKGRSNGTKRVDAAKGQNDAAQAWMDALEVYERAPASLEIQDRSVVFPVYSGVHGWLKGGKIQNDKDGYFEQNLARRFVRESKRFRRDCIHYLRAMGMLCEVTGAAGDYTTALELLEGVRAEYDATEHSGRIEKVYGVDRVATAIGMSAMWHDQMGRTSEALAVCDYVELTLLPALDGTNTLGMFELLVPVLKVLKQNGQHERCLNLFSKYVHEAFLTNHGPDAFTPTKSLHQPMVWMFALLHDSDNFSDFEEAVQWLAEGDNGTPNDFLDNIVIRTSWGPSDMAAELCLLVAKKLSERNQEGDAELCQKIAEKGLKFVRIADGKIKDTSGNVLLHFANKIHEPLIAEVESLAKELGVYTNPPPRTPTTPGVKVNLPPSYLVVPPNAAEFVGF